MTIYTGLVGVNVGQYRGYYRGQYIGMIFGRDAVEARQQLSEEIAAIKSAPAQVDWYTCPDCGASVDIGADCPVCAEELLFSAPAAPVADEIPFNGEPWPLDDDEYAELQDLRCLQGGGW